MKIGWCFFAYKENHSLSEWFKKGKLLVKIHLGNRSLV